MQLTSLLIKSKVPYFTFSSISLFAMYFRDRTENCALNLQIMWMLRKWQDKNDTRMPVSIRFWSKQTRSATLCLMCRPSWHLLLMAAWTALQSQKAVTAYLKSKQLLPFGFARQCVTTVNATDPDVRRQLNVVLHSGKAVHAYFSISSHCLLALHGRIFRCVTSILSTVGQYHIFVQLFPKGIHVQK